MHCISLLYISTADCKTTATCSLMPCTASVYFTFQQPTAKQQLPAVLCHALHQFTLHFNSRLQNNSYLQSYAMHCISLLYISTADCKTTAACSLMPCNASVYFTFQQPTAKQQLLAVLCHAMHQFTLHFNSRLQNNSCLQSYAMQCISLLYIS